MTDQAKEAITVLDQLTALAQAIRPTGLTAVILTPPGRPPRLRISSSGGVCEEIELIDGQWRWPWGELLPGATEAELAQAIGAYFASVP